MGVDGAQVQKVTLGRSGRCRLKDDSVGRECHCQVFIAVGELAGGGNFEERSEFDGSS